MILGSIKKLNAVLKISILHVQENVSNKQKGNSIKCTYKISAKKGTVKKMIHNEEGRN